MANAFQPNYPDIAGALDTGLKLQGQVQENAMRPRLQDAQLRGAETTNAFNVEKLNEAKQLNLFKKYAPIALNIDARWKSSLAKNNGDAGAAMQEIQPVWDSIYQQAQADGMPASPEFNPQENESFIEALRGQGILPKAKNDGKLNDVLATPQLYQNPETGAQEMWYFTKSGKPAEPVRKATNADIKGYDITFEREEAKREAKRSADLKASFPKVRGANASLDRQWDTVDKMIEKAQSQISPWTAGAASTLSNIPGTPQRDLRETLNTIRANIGFDKLQDMRANSPTGGALGQVSDLENRLLQAVQGSLEQAQSPAQLKENLANIKNMLNQLRQYKNEAYRQDYAQFIKESPVKQKTSEPMNDLPNPAQNKGRTILELDETGNPTGKKLKSDGKSWIEASIDALSKLNPFSASEAEAGELSPLSWKSNARMQAIQEADQAIDRHPTATPASETAPQEYKVATSNIRQIGGKMQMYVEGDFDSKWINLDDAEAKTLFNAGKLTDSQMNKIKKRGGLI